MDKLIKVGLKQVYKNPDLNKVKMDFQSGKFSNRERADFYKNLGNWGVNQNTDSFLNLLGKIPEFSQSQTAGKKAALTDKISSFTETLKLRYVDPFLKSLTRK